LKKPLTIVGIILLIDQSVKFWIKTNMSLGQEYKVLGDWFIIHFTENPGMAFGLEFAGEYGKLALSIFRIIAIIGIFYYLWKITRKEVHTGLLVSLSLVLAGAMGNMIDSAFYGMLFSSSNYFEVARFLPAEGGYATFLHGKVVDMTIGVLLLIIFQNKFFHTTEKSETAAVEESAENAEIQPESVMHPETDLNN
jgi:signal peptidase II